MASEYMTQANVIMTTLKKMEEAQRIEHKADASSRKKTLDTLERIASALEKIASKS